MWFLELTKAYSALLLWVMHVGGGGGHGNPMTNRRNQVADEEVEECEEVEGHLVVGLSMRKFVGGV